VDINGEIKNCPSSAISYGNIANTSLIKAIKNNNFQKNWFISKDEIEVCKDCEFRYICIDCRVFVQDSKNQYSKPSKCNYDPYTATFKN
jgi:SPASM domain peptide maturase of grasp-with-spasm system